MRWRGTSKGSASRPPKTPGMKIIHIINSLDPAAGGPPVVAACLAAAQTALGHEVHILSIKTAGADDRISRAYARVPGFPRVMQQFLSAGGVLERVLARNS